MKKEPITVGNATMFATLIPVNVVFEDIFAPADKKDGLLADRFRVLEIDGAYLTIHERIYEDRPSHQSYKAFLTKRESLEYVELFGVEVPKDEEEE